MPKHQLDLINLLNSSIWKVTSPDILIYLQVETSSKENYYECDKIQYRTGPALLHIKGQ